MSTRIPLALARALAGGVRMSEKIQIRRRDTNAVLYRESQFAAICEAIAGRAIAAKRAALLPT